MSTDTSTTSRFIRVSDKPHPGGTSSFARVTTRSDYDSASVRSERSPANVRVDIPQFDGSTRSVAGTARYSSEGGRPGYYTIRGNNGRYLGSVDERPEEGQVFEAREPIRVPSINITGPRIEELASSVGDDESIAPASEFGSQFGDDDDRTRGRSRDRAKRAQTPAPSGFGRVFRAASVADESEEGDSDTASEASVNALNERDTNDSSGNTNETSSFWSRLSSFGQRIGILPKSTSDTPDSSDNSKQFIGDGTGVNAPGAFPGTVPTPTASVEPPPTQASGFTFSDPTPTPQQTTTPDFFAPPPPPPPPPPAQPQQTAAPVTTSGASTGQAGPVRSFLSRLWTGTSTPTVGKQREPVRDPDNPTIYDLIRSHINASLGLDPDASVNQTFMTFARREQQRKLASQYRFGPGQGIPSLGQSTFGPNANFGQNTGMSSSQATMDPRIASLLAARQAQAFGTPVNSEQGFSSQTQGTSGIGNPSSNPGLASLMAQLQARQTATSGGPGNGQFSVYR